MVVGETMITKNQLNILKDTYLSRIKKAVPYIVNDHLEEMKQIKEFNLYIKYDSDYPSDLSNTFHSYSHALFLPEEEYQNFLINADKEGVELGVVFADSNYFTIELMMKLTHSTRMCSIRRLMEVMDSYPQAAGTSLLIERFYELTNKRQNAFFEGYIHKQNEKLRKQSFTDSLTGLYNRRYFYQYIVEIMEKAYQIGSPITLLLIDLNDLKKINDEFGHLAGDQLLKQFSTILKDIHSSVEGVFRFGGDEFVLTLTNCHDYEVEEIAIRIDKKINAYQSKASISFGVTKLPLIEKPERIKIDHYIQIADQRMYNYKALYKSTVQRS